MTMQSRLSDALSHLTRWQGAAAALLLAALLLPGLGRAGLLDPWEMDRAAVARRMAAGPRVLVVEGAKGDLLPALERAAPQHYGLAHPSEQDASAHAAVTQAVTWLGKQVAHAVVIDIDAALADRVAPRVDTLASQVVQIEDASRGSAFLLVTQQPETTPIRQALARARARSLQQSLHGAAVGVTVFDGEPLERAFSGLLLQGDEVFTTPANLAQNLALHCPSPFWMPVHKRDGQTVTTPWLDAALTAASLRILGPSETAARLPGALLAILTGVLLVLAVRRLWGSTEAWLVLLVYATLPMTWGLARTVTFEATAPLGLTLATLGLALGAANRSKLWLLWWFAGLAVLLLGLGMTGLVTAAVLAVAATLALGDLRRMGLAALTALVLLGVAALVIYRGDPDAALLRSLRFTWWPFGAGPDAFHRYFSLFLGQLGFALYPWGAPLVLGAARLLGTPGVTDAETPLADRIRPGAVVLCGLVAAVTVDSILIRQFNHFVAPVGPLAALVTAVMLGDLLAGRVGGRVIALFVGLGTLLLHHDLGKEAASVTRFIAFDPPLTNGTGEPMWPTELALPRGLRAVALLSVLAFAFGTARPAQTVRSAVEGLRRTRAAAWALGIAGILWALDVLISLGTKLDVLLKAEANTTNYNYDRIWVTLQGLRPEVIAGAVLFVLVLTCAAVATLLDRAAIERRGYLRLPFQLGAVLQWPTAALALSGAAAVGVLLSGCAVLVHVQHVGWGRALAMGMGSAAFLLPVLVAVTVVGVRALTGRLRMLDPLADDSLLAPLADGIRGHFALALGLPVLAAVAGIGASQASGTWTYAFLAATWALALLVAFTIIGRAQFRVGSYGWPLAAVGLVVAGSVFGPLAVRYVQENVAGAMAGQEAMERKDALKYLGHVLFTAVDTGALLAFAAFVVVNRLAARHLRLHRVVEFALGLVQRLQKPAVAVGALVMAGAVFSTAYAFSLLPGLAVHYSQKHLLVKIAEAGGTAKDPAGAPRTFTYGSARTGGDNNFYTQSMPRIEDRAAVLALLADKNVATRITDNAEGGATRQLALAGWSDALDTNHDGKRDQPGWFGIATRVDGTHVQVTGANWPLGQWTGASLYGPDAKVAVAVVGNTADSLDLTQPATLTANDPGRGAIALDTIAAGTGTSTDGAEHSGMQPVQRFVVVPKDAFSELNHAFRLATGGQHIPVLDAASSRLVLATNRLQGNQPDQNWLRKAVLTPQQFAQVPGVVRMYANFDNSIELIGYKLAETAVARSQKYKLTFYWKVKKPTATSWKLFMHPHPLHLDRWPLTEPDPSEDENKPCNGCFQTNHWLVGDIIADSFEQEVPLGTQSGPNEIILGWYNPSSDTRMPVISATGEGVIKHGDNRVTIGQLQVR
jgi:4-amino-4-deoxy-L-arabinose transferase-like glycosyltransferase